LRFDLTSSSDRIQGRLTLFAVVFLFLFSLILTLSPAGPARTWDVPYRWDHWIGFAVWLVLLLIAHQQTARHLPDRDPYLLPVAGLLSGWGLLTIWRLFPSFGIRQSVWLAFSVIVFIFLVRLPNILALLRQYKYVWLTASLLLTALTLLFGTNPSGSPFSRLWLGGPDIYFQPSEPLKLFLLVYLAAYLAGTEGGWGAARVLKITRNLLPFLAPTILMGGLALLLLMFQRDLGTAFIILFLYASVVYVASARKIILLLAGLAAAVSAAAGYLIFDVVRIRMDAWLNPWLDPSGRSYQIVQSLLAVANGGIFGRGPGLGSPGVVPIAHSDFVFISIVEESGLLAAIGVLILLSLLVTRGLRAAICAPNSYQRYLAAGLTTYLAAQSLLIIGGNIRMLPLTGVTLPFVSYGGSSLLTAFLGLAVLLQISSHAETGSGQVTNPHPYKELGAMLYAGLMIAGLLSGWWSVVRAPDLLVRADNPRRSIAERYVRRGALLDRHNRILTDTTGNPGSLSRIYTYPELSPVLGYNHPVYGQSGLEASLDSYLRGLEGQSLSVRFWNHLLYGQPPPGLDVRLTIDKELQKTADDLLHNRTGALVLLNSQGEILVMSSYPNFDPNQLDETWSDLIQDERAPLLNRASQGLYTPGPVLGPLILAAYYEAQITPGGFPPQPASLSYQVEWGSWSQDLNCAVPPDHNSWEAFIASGCPSPIAVMAQEVSDSSPLGPSSAMLALFDRWGFYSIPEAGIPAASTSPPDEVDGSREAFLELLKLRLSPLQLALSAAALSAEGSRPNPYLASMVRSPDGSWQALPHQGEPAVQTDTSAAQKTIQALMVEGLSIWQTISIAANGPDQMVTWYLGGELPQPGKPALAITLLLEEQNPELAQEIGQMLLLKAIQP
jgi:cell division protein FtsW (lipid II flippase)